MAAPVHRVLIVSYFFPPTNTIGAIRVGKFAKYLHEFGWEPWVLTIDSRLLRISRDLEVEIPEAQVIRADFGNILTPRLMRRAPVASPAVQTLPATRPTDGPDLRRRLWQFVSGLFTDVRMPDRALPWYLPAIRAGDALLRSASFDAILSLHGPPASDVVASVLAKRHGVPWVADFRDLWSGNHNLRRPDPIHWVERLVERGVMAPCRHMVTVSPPLARELQTLHDVPVTVIPNGFDEEEYPPGGPPRPTGVFRIVYTGTIYESNQDPSPLFAALRQLLSDGLLRTDGVRVEFYGTQPAFVHARAAEQGVSEVVHVYPRLPHAEIRALQQAADVLLVLDWMDPEVGFYSGKVFEYLGARRPILAIGPRGGVIDALLRDTRAGVMATTAAEAEEALRGWIVAQQEMGTVPYAANAAAVGEFSRRALTRRLAAVLDGAAGVVRTPEVREPMATPPSVGFTR